MGQPQERHRCDDVGHSIRRLVAAWYEELEVHLESVSVRYTRDPHKRQDFIQEAFVRILQDRPDSVSKMKQLGEKELHNAYKRDLRRRKKAARLAQAREVSDSRASFSIDVAVRLVVSTKPLLHQLIWNLVVEQGLSKNEAAHRLGLSTRHLRRILQKDFEDVKLILRNGS